MLCPEAMWLSSPLAPEAVSFAAEREPSVTELSEARGEPA